MKNEKCTYEFLGENLYKFRKERGLSQEELADKASVSRQSIHLWESGKIYPDIENILKLSEILNVQPGNLVNGLDNIFPNKSKTNTKRVFKIVLIIILILLILYMIISLRKSFILIKLDRKTQEFSVLDNYSYIEHYSEEKDLKMENNYTITAYYKNGIYVENYKDFNEHNRNDTLWIDRNQNKAYYFDNNKMTYQERNAEEFSVEGKQMLYYTATPSRVTPKSNLINILYGFNPNLRVESKKDRYITTLYNQVGNLKLKVCEHINKETGLVNSIFTYFPDGKVTSKLFEIKLNETQDDNVSLPDLSNYTKIM